MMEIIPTYDNTVTLMSFERLVSKETVVLHCCGSERIKFGIKQID